MATGAADPGYKFADENLEGKYTRGTVAMANSGPNTNGSQFFIIHKDYDLPNSYVIFGHVSSGMDAVDKIAECESRRQWRGRKIQAGQSGENRFRADCRKIGEIWGTDAPGLTSAHFFDIIQHCGSESQST